MKEPGRSAPGAPPDNAPARRDRPLRATQELIWELIAAPEGVRPGIEALRAAGRFDVGGLAAVIQGDGQMSAEDRLDIYASMYFYRLRDALAEDFPKTAAVMGGARFHNLVTDFLLAHPSRHWSLRHLGDPFADFLAGHPLGRSQPFLADLARVEWARIDVFDAADAPVLTREAAAAAGAGLGLSLVPAVRLLRLDWSVAPLWLWLESGDGEVGTAGHSAAVSAQTGEVFAAPVPIETPPRRQGHMLVWRRQRTVLHRSLDPGEHSCLEAMRSGVLSLPLLGERLVEQAESDGAEDPVGQATARLAELVARWIGDGLLAPA